VSYEHESLSYQLGRFIDILTEELALPVAGGRSTTFKVPPKQCALEPDNCYWIAHEAELRGKVAVDLLVDPVPDLAIEVVVPSGLLNRMPLYRRLRFPEVWRYRRRVLEFAVLQCDRAYERNADSACFPGLTARDLAPFLALHGKLSATDIIRQFRAWVRQQIAAGVLKPPTP